MVSPQNTSSELARHWPLVFACAVGIGGSAIALPFYTIGVLVGPLESSFGWSRAGIQTGILFSTGCGAFSAPLIGMLIDRFGARKIVLPSILALAFAFLLASRVTSNIWTFYAAFAGISLLGAGTNPATWTRAIAGAFTRQRGIALGLALSGTGLCALLAPKFAGWLDANFGWRSVFIGLAVFTAAVTWPVAFALFKDNQVPASAAECDAVKTGKTLKQAMAGYRFWVLLTSIFAIYLAVSGIIPNLIPAMMDKGFSSAKAGSVAASIGASLLFGRLAIGYLVDRLWPPGVAAVATSLPIIGCIILSGTPGFAAAVFSACLIGFAAGAELDLLAFFTARYFGLKHYGRIYGVFYIALAIAGGLAPRLFAMQFDGTGSYDDAFLLSAALFGLGAAILLTLGRKT